MTLLLTASCGGTETPAGTSDTTQPEETSAPETSRFLADSLPDDLDFGGKEVHWLIGDYQSAYWNDFYAEEETGERMNDAVYGAARSIEERLNVKLDFIRYEFAYNDRSTYSDLVAKDIMTGDRAYDLLTGRNLNYMNEEDEYLLDMSQTKYIDFTKPWWNQYALDFMPGGAVWSTTGDGSLSQIKHTFCVFFNQDQLDDFGVGDPYKMLDDHTWTLDKLNELAELGWRDLNGDSTADLSDNYGLTFGDANKYIGFQYGAGCKVVVKGTDGYEIPIGNERAADVFDKCYSLIFKNPGSLPGTGNSAQPDHVQTVTGNYADNAFIDGRAMFSCSLVGDAPTIIGDAKFGYGILPYPMFDETQEDYISSSQREAYFSLPVTCDADLCSAVFEAWSSACYRMVQPEYFETTLKVRYSEDDNMSRVFDLLRSNLYMDVAGYYSEQTGAMTGLMKDLLLGKKEGQWSSTVASKMDGWQTALDKSWNILSGK